MPTSRARLAAAGTAAICTLAGIAAPAQAATIGPRAADNTCSLTLTPGEQAYVTEQPYVTGLNPPTGFVVDQAFAIERVFPAANPIGEELEQALTSETPASAITLTEKQHATLKAAGMPDALIQQYVDARLGRNKIPDVAHPKVRPATDPNRIVADARESLRPAPVQFPLADASLNNPVLHQQLTNAWRETPSGKRAEKWHDYNNALFNAHMACAKGEKQVAFPALNVVTEPLPTSDLSSKLSSDGGGNRVDVVLGAVISLVAALAGLVALAPKLGIKLPF